VRLAGSLAAHIQSGAKLPRAARDQFAVQTRAKTLEDRSGAQAHSERQLFHAGFDPRAPSTGAYDPAPDFACSAARRLYARHNRGRSRHVTHTSAPKNVCHATGPGELRRADDHQDEDHLA